MYGKTNIYEIQHTTYRHNDDKKEEILIWKHQPLQNYEFSKFLQRQPPPTKKGTRSQYDWTSETLHVGKSAFWPFCAYPKIYYTLEKKTKKRGGCAGNGKSDLTPCIGWFVAMLPPADIVTVVGLHLSYSPKCIRQYTEWLSLLPVLEQYQRKN